MKSHRSMIFLIVVVFIVNIFANDEILLPKQSSVEHEKYQLHNLDASGILINPNYSNNYQFNNTSKLFESQLNRDFEDPIIINSFSIPDGVTGLEFIDEYLWGVFYGGDLHIIDPVDGSIETTIVLSIFYPCGITEFEDYLIVSDKTNSQFVKLDIETLEVIEYIPTPVPEPNYLNGIHWDGSHLWHNDARLSNGSSENVTVKMNSNFQIITEFHITDLFPESNYPTGLTYDGQYVWLSENGLGYIHQVNRDDFSVNRTIVWPNNYPNAIAFDGQYLWVGDNETDMIYQLDINSGSSVENIVLNTEKVNLLQNYPNPFNPSTTIKYNLKENANVTVEIFNIKGQKINTLVNKNEDAGYHTVIWDGKDNVGNPISSGIYLYQLSINDRIIDMRKCILLE